MASTRCAAPNAGFLVITHYQRLAGSRRPRPPLACCRRSSALPELRAAAHAFRASRPAVAHAGGPGARPTSAKVRARTAACRHGVPDAGWLAGLPAGRVVLVDGRVHAIETGELPAGVAFGFAEAAGCRRCQPHSTRCRAPMRMRFAALNSALFEDGVLVHVAAGARLDRADARALEQR